MPTDVISSIGSSGRDYSTLQAWEDACPSNLVTDDKRWIGECYNDSEFSSGSPLLAVGGITTDSTRYVYLKCGAGQSFRDHTDVRTNALVYDQTKGVGIKCTGGGYTTSVDLSIAYTRVENLQFHNTGASNTNVVLNAYGVSGVSVGSCIVKGGGHGFYGDFTVKNTLIYDSGVNGARPINLISLYGCTVVNCFTGINCSAAYTASVVKNSAVFGCTTNASGSSSRFNGSDYVATDGASFPGDGTHYVTSLTYADQFESTTNDFRAKSTGDLQAGTPDATNTPDDITGLTRDATTPWIGCWEVAGGGAFDPANGFPYDQLLVPYFRRTDVVAI